jgi:hypothetical protein
MPRFHCDRCQTDFLSLRARTTPCCPGCGARWPNESYPAVTKLAKSLAATSRTARLTGRFNRPTPDLVRAVFAQRAADAVRRRKEAENEG